MSALLLINGPNLNLLGSREPEVYGATRLDDIEANCIELAEELGHSLDCFQSNAEHELIDRVQKAAADGVAFILLNPGAFTHTSVALRDALQAHVQRRANPDPSQPGDPGEALEQVRGLRRGARQLQ